MEEARRPRPPLDCPPESPDLLEPAPLNGPLVEEALAAFAKALAHPVRVRILMQLARRDARMCAEIVGELPLAQSTVSEHLRILREAKLVCAREDGVRTGYCIERAALRRLKALLERALPSDPPVLLEPAVSGVPRKGTVRT